MATGTAVVLVRARGSCFVSLPQDWAARLESLHLPQIFKCTWDTGAAFLGWNGSLSTDSHLVVDPRFAAAIGLADGASVHLSAVTDPLPSCTRAELKPCGPADWDILESNAAWVEDNLLDQVVCIWPGLTLPIWINSSVALTTVATAEPAAECVCLTRNSELHVAPSLRTRAQPSSIARRPRVQPTSNCRLCSPDLAAARDPLVVLQDFRAEGYPLDLCEIGFSARIGQIGRSIQRPQHVAEAIVSVQHSGAVLPGHVAIPDSTLALLGVEPFERVQLSSLVSEGVAVSRVRLRLCKFEPFSKKSKKKKKKSPQSQLGQVQASAARKRTADARQKVGTAASEELPSLENLVSRLGMTAENQPPLELLPGALLCLSQSTSMTSESEGEMENSSSIRGPSRDTKELYVSVELPSDADLQLGANQHLLVDLANLSVDSTEMAMDELLTLRLPPRTPCLCSEPCLEHYGGRGPAFAHIAGFFETTFRFWSIATNLAPTRAPSALIYGRQGTGKSLLCKALCNVYSFRRAVYVEELRCSEMVGIRPDVAHKTLSDCFERVQERAPSVLLLDDLHLMLPHSEEGDIAGWVGQTLAELIVSRMTTARQNGYQILLLATSLSLESLCPELQDALLFDTLLEMKPPSEVERRSILDRVVQRLNLQQAPAAELLSNVARRSEGYVGRDLQLLVDAALQQAARRTISEVAAQKSSALATKNLLKLTREDFSAAMDAVVPAALQGLQLHDSSLGWDCVGGLQKVKQMLVEMFEWPARYPTLFAQCPIRLCSGLLLYGPPGCGKTYLANAAAKECGLRFIGIKGAELLNKYIGQSEQAVRELFDRAQAAAPCIIFFDEFEAIAPRRGHDSTGVTDRVVNQLLTQLDGVEAREGVFVLAATSRPDLIDGALLRPGRIDKSACLSLPDEQERHEILQAHARDMRLAPSVDLSAIAACTEHFSGADLKAVLANAELETIHALTEALPLAPAPILEGTEETHVPGTGHLAFRPASGLCAAGAAASATADAAALLAQVATIVSEADAEGSTSSRDAKSELAQLPRVDQAALLAAARALRPSVSPADRARYEKIYAAFSAGREMPPATPDSRATLA
eukprot:m.112975 g.112975  ORF g.112975 m.112975 type:complete len:1097 (+) comp9412_c0_seq1:118-3408(+)